MSAVQYLGGLALLGLIVASLAFGARALRRAWLPAWSGAPGWLAEAVLGLAMLVGVTELLGMIGILQLVPLVLACAAAGLAAHLLAQRTGRTPGAEPPPAPPSVGRPLAAVAVAVVVADWSARVGAAIGDGMESVDTVWYQLPQAARFFQEGSITGIHFFDGEPLTSYYPATASLFHAVGMILFDHDILSLFLNMGWLGLACLAGWCVGRAWGLGPAGLLGVAIVLATPIMASTQAGAAYSDVAGLALFLASLALLLNARGQRSATFLAGLAAGLALGVKLTFIPPVAALTVGVAVVAWRGRNTRLIWDWLIAIAVMGGFWYLRNLIYAGNPFPPAEIQLGPLSLPHAPQGTASFALAEYLTDAEKWEDIFLPGLLKAFGPVWWAIVALAGAGMVLALVRGDSPAMRMLGGVGLACAAAFVVLPQALGVKDNPFLFTYNLRYATPALAAGLVLLPVVPWLREERRRRWVLLALVAILLITQLDPSLWPTDLRDEPFEEAVEGRALKTGIGAGIVTLAAGLLIASGRIRPGSVPRRTLVAGLAAVTAIAVAVGGWVQHVYLRDRYTRSLPMPVTYRWAQDVSDKRIGVIGVLLQYPLYGRDLSNHVQYVGVRGDEGDFDLVRSCPEWRRVINDGDYDYVVTAPPGFPAPFGSRSEAIEAEWMRSDPAATEVLTEDAVGSRIAVFRIAGELDENGCGSQA